MCKMVIFLASKNTTTNIDKVFYESWKTMNDDGYGYYAIGNNGDGKLDYSKAIIARSPDCKGNIPKFPDKTMFMLHCRAATGGKGNHPFISEDKRLLLIHNGIISGYEIYRKELIKKGHKFRTSIDSEILLHALEEANEHKFEKIFTKEGVDDLIKALNDKNVHGSINFICYDQKTMDWIAYSDGNLNIGKPLMGNIDFLVIASTLAPISDLCLVEKRLSDGEYFIGNGSKINVFSKNDGLKSSYTYVNYNSGYGCGIHQHSTEHEAGFYVYPCSKDCCRIINKGEEMEIICANTMCAEMVKTLKSNNKKINVCSWICYDDIKKNPALLTANGGNHMCRMCLELPAMNDDDLCSTCIDIIDFRAGGGMYA